MGGKTYLRKEWKISQLGRGGWANIFIYTHGGRWRDEFNAHWYIERSSHMELLGTEAMRHNRDFIGKEAKYHNSKF